MEVKTTVLVVITMMTSIFVMILNSVLKVKYDKWR